MKEYLVLIHKYIGGPSLDKISSKEYEIIDKRADADGVIWFRLQEIGKAVPAIKEVSLESISTTHLSTLYVAAFLWTWDDSSQAYGPIEN